MKRFMKRIKEFLADCGKLFRINRSVRAAGAIASVRSLQGKACPDGDSQRNPPRHRGRVKGLRMDTCRHDPGAWQIRQKQ